MTRTLWTRIAPALVVACAWPVDSPAQSLTTVAVRVNLVAHDFRIRFRDKLDMVLAERFAAYLSPRVGFLEFVPGDTDSQYRLVFDLDQQERGSTGTFQEFGFWARLEGTPVDALELYWLPVRPADQNSSGIGNRMEFLSRITTLLTHADVGPVRDSLLQEVPITHEALHHRNPFGWALAFRPVDLCLRNSSKLRFVNERLVSGVPLERRVEADVTGTLPVSPPVASNVEPYLGGLFSEPDPQTAAQLLVEMANSSMHVKDVFVVLSRHDPNACRDRGEQFGAGGGQ